MDDVFARVQNIALELTKSLVETRMKPTGGDYVASMIPSEAVAVGQAFAVIYQHVCAAVFPKPKGAT